MIGETATMEVYSGWVDTTVVSKFDSVSTTVGYTYSTVDDYTMGETDCVGVGDTDVVPCIVPCNVEFSYSITGGTLCGFFY